jgi:hydrogenase expression/formation protein HypC
MCLLIPGRIVAIADDLTRGRTATIEYPGLTRSAALTYLPEAEVGDFVLVQAGFAMRRLSPEQAADAIAAMDHAAQLLGGSAGGASPGSAGEGDRNVTPAVRGDPPRPGSAQ